MLRLFAGSLLIAGVVSCGATDPQILSVTTTVDRTTVARNDSVRVTLTVTNVSRRVVRGVSPDSYGICINAFRVFDDAQREVSVPHAFCLQAAPSRNLVGPSSIELPPGATVTIVDYWVPGSSTINGSAIPPTFYRIVGEYHADNRVFSAAAPLVELLQ